ncbi:hypothetical protein EVAR_46725_1 [Eumeta japonica]|uniref:Uncharacterized protein n=1 Tax=Eumeta variegata TaxID=151549 RepID=A0A4C1XE33_EUMVA|nr:hypothetical protein EVAR_46725_1 [Eumeta japonica]
MAADVTRHIILSTSVGQSRDVPRRLIKARKQFEEAGSAGRRAALAPARPRSSRRQRAATRERARFTIKRACLIDNNSGPTSKKARQGYGACRTQIPKALA